MYATKKEQRRRSQHDEQGRADGGHGEQYRGNDSGHRYNYHDGNYGEREHDLSYGAGNNASYLDNRNGAPRVASF